jgi:hypothetical protein
MHTSIFNLTDHASPSMLRNLVICNRGVFATLRARVLTSHKIMSHTLWIFDRAMRFHFSVRHVLPVHARIQQFDCAWG